MFNALTCTPHLRLLQLPPLPQDFVAAQRE